MVSNTYSTETMSAGHMKDICDEDGKKPAILNQAEYFQNVSNEINGKLIMYLIKFINKYYYDNFSFNLL